MADQDKPVVDGGAGNVEQIRDILFGAQMREYERRFLDLDRRLEADLARLRESQEKRVAEVEKRIDDQLDQLGKRLHQEMQERGSALADLESNLQQAARTARGELDKTLDALGQELAAKDERQRAALADAQASAQARAGETESALSRIGAELHASKVGREDLSALLSELALRLKGDVDSSTPK